MIAKSLIATATLAAVSAGMTSTAEAKVHINGFVNIGAPGLYVGPGYGYGYGPTYVDEYYGGDCGWTTVKRVKWINGHKIVKFKKKWVCY